MNNSGTKLKYSHTKYACCAGNAASSIISTLPPLLYVSFRKDFNLSLDQISYFIMATFGLQLAFSCVASLILKRIGYRACTVLSQLLYCASMLLLGVLPFVMAPFWGILIAITPAAMASGVFCVIINPIIEWLPDDTRRGAMGVMHSYFCWGCAAITLITALYLDFFGEDSWRFLPFIWCVFPLLCALYFIKVPLPDKHVSKAPVNRKFFTNIVFIAFAVMLLCAGAAEKSVSQWASLFAQQGLHVSQFIGNILGPFAFALLMAISRVLFAKTDDSKLLRVQIILGIFLFISYMIMVGSPVPIVSLISCGLCGFFVGPLWPCMNQLAGARFLDGGAAMFAALSVGGYIGCTIGPTITGFISESVERQLSNSVENSADPTAAGLTAGLFAASMFAAAFVVIGILVSRKKIKKEVSRT